MVGCSPSLCRHLAAKALSVSGRIRHHRCRIFAILCHSIPASGVPGLLPHAHSSQPPLPYCCRVHLRSERQIHDAVLPVLPQVPPSEFLGVLRIVNNFG
ncbi:unnamed protein product [Cuscuta campestris]|uniref:Uncharacterized protein n=1 Tax=Cuscuta campestris TaxID=132261 RepID=A0A484K6N2_9ASTE|nr:unnamed protein product [Cuscuta campestris]